MLLQVLTVHTLVRLPANREIHSFGHEAVSSDDYIREHPEAKLSVSPAHASQEAGECVGG